MAYYGKYRAEVVDVADPEQRGRIRVRCPEVLGTQISRWALPCFMPNTFTVPAKGTLVWVEFEGGRKDSPIWAGVFYTKDQWKSKFGTYNPNSYIIKAPRITVIGDIHATGNITDADGEVHSH